MNNGTKVRHRDHPDFSEKERGGYQFAEGIVDEHIGNWTPATDTHAPPMFRFYRATDKAEWSYYLCVENRGLKVFGLTTEQARMAHASLVCNPGLPEHRPDTAYEAP